MYVVIIKQGDKEKVDNAEVHLCKHSFDKPRETPWKLSQLQVQIHLWQ